MASILDMVIKKWSVWAALSVATILPWWLSLGATAFPSFYKEWVSVVGLALAGILIDRDGRSVSLGKNNSLTWASVAIVAVLLIECVLDTTLLSKAQLMFAAVSFFLLAMLVGSRLRLEQGEDAFTRLASCILIAAVGSSLLALWQLLSPNSSSHFVVERAGRLVGNVGQPNHFADLLWLGVVACCLLIGNRRLSIFVGALFLALLEVFAAFSGSRACWLYALVIVLLGAVVLFERRGGEIRCRRLALSMISASLGYLVVIGIVNGSGVADSFGVMTAEQRPSDLGSADESNRQRLWFWRSGVAAAQDHPVLGVGPGQLAGYMRDRALARSDAPANGADAQAHNIFIQLAAELGLPVAVFVAIAAAMWFRVAWRASRWAPDGLAALAMVLIVFIHANVEHPLGSTYFLVIVGLLVGYIGPTTALARSRPSKPWLALTSFLLLAMALYGYVTFRPVEKAATLVAAQIAAGQAPHFTAEIGVRLDEVWKYSPFADLAESVTLIAALPTSQNAAELAERCERNVRVGPTPFLLSRCAVDNQVAGRPDRATNFANSLCQLYPGSSKLLAQAMSTVASYQVEFSPVVSVCQIVARTP